MYKRRKLGTIYYFIGTIFHAFGKTVFWGVLFLQFHQANMEN